MKDDHIERLDRWIDAPETGDPGDVAPLVSLAADLKRRMAPPPAPAGTRDRVWARVQREMRPAPRALRRRPGGLLLLRPAYAIAGVMLAIFLGLGTTAAYASEAALPGDPLYPVKRGLETASLALSTSAEGHAGLVASFADRRLAEIEALTALGRWQDVASALASYPETVEGLQEVDPGVVEAQLGRHIEVLERVRSQAPESAKSGLDRALERAGRGRQEAKDRQGEKKPRTDPPGQRKKDSGTPEGIEGWGPPGKGRWPGRIPPGWEKKLTPTP